MPVSAVVSERQSLAKSVSWLKIRSTVLFLILKTIAYFDRDSESRSERARKPKEANGLTNGHANGVDVPA